MSFNPYVNLSNTEADLRKELTDMFFGNDYEVAKGHRVLLRRMRRDSNDLPIACECVDELTQEATPKCPSCLGEGWLWDEEWVTTRRVDIGSTANKLILKNMHMGPGIVNVDTIVFFFEFDVQPTWYDRIVELREDINGTPLIPYRRYKVHRPQSVIDYRSDNGRIEFYAVYVSQKDSIQQGNTFRK